MPGITKKIKIRQDWKLSITILILILLLKTTESTEYKLPKLCQRKTETSKCEVWSVNTKLSSTFDQHKRAKCITICKLQDEFVNLELINDNLPNLEKLIIYESDVSRVLLDYPVPNKLRSLVIRNSSLNYLSSSLLLSMKHLKSIDLRGNLLTSLNQDVVNILPKFNRIYLSGNPWDCSQNLTWTVDPELSSKIKDLNNLTCSKVMCSGKPVASVMYIRQEMERECPTDICTCDITNIVWDREMNYLVPLITVNCSYQELTDFPPKIPRNTTTLYLTGNHITSLQTLVQDKMYQRVVDVYLDHNQIKNIDNLEGADWLKNFRVFSLKGNQITELPTYAFDNSFERNTNLAKIYLGHNPWRCDCIFTPAFQHLLLKFQLVIKDIDDIKCADNTGEEVALEKITELPRNAICVTPDTELNPLDIVSCVLATLIILVFGKLIYDYWTFKKTGKLPWLVTKIP